MTTMSDYGRYFSTALLLMLALTMAGCSEAEEPGMPQGWRQVTAGMSETPTSFLWTDPGTGCVYLWVDASYAGGLFPRLRRDGKVDCPDVKQ